MTGEGIVRKAEYMSLAALLLLGASACSAQGNFKTPNDPAASQRAQENAEAFQVGPWTVNAGTRIRYDPEEIENVDGTSNVCFKLGSEIEITVPAVQVSDDPNNGSWLGFNSADFPDEIRSACGEDKDSTLWIKGTLVIPKG